MERLLIKIGRSYHFVDERKIDLIKSDRNYSRIHCDGKSFLIRRSLRSLEEKLNSDRFLRINKSTIVNVEMIDHMKDIGNNNFIVVLNNNKTVQWGRRYREKLVQLIKV